ncbi:hypothetical protein GWI33_011272 [Rhynchophorus ferrugineus]|uniref:Uncharacterized protein n=1 Tax=Rhynchophorus ferrugineus TaxID=354439 RepID=A0A834ICZ4_RHYFE|nr:hypothetical protein GWI33_011272 [Rhynchophorus ferrugineus]
MAQTQLFVAFSRNQWSNRAGPGACIVGEAQKKRKTAVVCVERALDDCGMALKGLSLVDSLVWVLTTTTTVPLTVKPAVLRFDSYQRFFGCVLLSLF